MLCAAAGWDGKHSEWGEPCLEERVLRSSRKADGGGVSGSSGVKDDSKRPAISAAPPPVMAGEAPVGLRLRAQYR